MTAPSTSEIRGPVAGPMQMPLSPEEFSLACRALVERHNGDEAHLRLDWLVTDLLSSLGYGEGMAVFLAHVRQYHEASA